MSLDYEIQTAYFLATPRPIIPESGHGAVVKDIDGNEYLDFLAGFATLNLGHSHPKLIEQLKEQADKMTHFPDGPNLYRALLAKKLAEITPEGLRKSTFSLGGGCAVELGLKLAKTYTGKYGFIAFHGGYHGRTTLGCLSLTTDRYSREGCGPLMPGVVHVPYAYCYRCSFGKEYPECGLWCAKYVRNLFEGKLTAVSDIAGLVVEPIQGVGGYIVPPDEYIVELSKICKDHGILLIMDEVQTAFGRYGDAMTASEALKIEPDIICMGKALSGGLPLSAVITKDEIAAKWRPIKSSETFMGNSLMCAVALTNISVLEEMNAPKKAKELGAYMLRVFKENLEDKKMVGEVRGKGCFLAIELVEDKETKKPVSKEAVEFTHELTMKKGLIVNFGSGNYGNVINVTPPLIATEKQVDLAAQILKDALVETSKQHP
jgi:4-aminobutyrate aminotransferase-like enzyme